MTDTILLLRGAPGAGKSTTAEALRTSHGFAIVEVDDLRGELWHVPPLAGFSDSQRHHVALAQAAVMALAMRAVGRRVAVVDTFNDNGIAALDRALRGRASTLPVALVVTPATLARRLATRKDVHGVFRDVEVSMRMNEELLGALCPHIDTTVAAPAEIAAHVLELLEQADGATP